MPGPKDMLDRLLGEPTPPAISPKHTPKTKPGTKPTKASKRAALPRARGGADASISPDRVRVICHADAALLDRLKRAAWHLHRAVSRITADAIRVEVERLEREHRRGRPFPPIPPGEGFHPGPLPSTRRRT